MKTKSPDKLHLNQRFLIYGAILVMAAAIIPTSATAQVSNAAQTETAPPPPPPVPGTMEGDAYLYADVMPQYPGGDIALLKYIAVNTQYPKEAKDKGIMGRVIIRFKVSADGSVANATVIKGVDPLLDSEAVRVVNTLSNFTPGQYNGENVPVW